MSAVETLGKYELRRQLGRGAMGTVYEAFDPVIERIVAIKTVRLPEVADDETKEEIARFRREAQAAGRLTHPNIVGVFDYGETADLAYIVMEYVDGPSLKNLLDKNERFPLPKIVRIMEDLLSGLQFSHERGVVHRDIKPANLMLTKAGQGKIADFGIARIESSSMTQAGTVLGTPAYMSPEQFMGQVVDARSDIYSSGVLLYQLLTGERPFEGSMSAIMHKALNTEAPAPSQISVTAPRPFDAVVRKAMAKRPEDRYASAAEFMAAIRAAATAPAIPMDAMDDNGEATMIAAPRPASGGAARGADRGAASGADLSVASLAASIAPPPPPRPQAVTTGKGGKSSVLPIALGGGVVVLAVVGGLGYYLMSGRSSTPETQPNPSPAVTAPTPVAPPQMPRQAPATPPVATAPLQPVTPPPTVAPTVPPSAVTQPPVNQPANNQPAPVVPPIALAPSPPAPVTPTPVPPPRTLLPTTPPTQTPLPVGPPPDPSVALRAEVAGFVARLPCSMFDGDVRDGQVQVGGIAGRAAIDSLRQKLSAMGLGGAALRATQVDQAFCPWEDLLRPVARPFGDPGDGFSLRLPGDPPFLVKDEYIRPRLSMANFRGEMHVDYLDRQGNVQHLYPLLADPGQRVAGDAPHVFDPGEAISLGEPGPNNPGWQVDEPYGTDLIIAIASEDALFDRPRPGNIEKAAVYLRDLKRALESARSRGARVTATAMPLETRRK
jgi:serine/threonine-protein kinase